MSTEVDFRPSIDAEVKINAGLYLKLSTAAAAEHTTTDLFAERLLEGALRDFWLFKEPWPPPQKTR
jgi:hypothetical protein